MTYRMHQQGMGRSHSGHFNDGMMAMDLRRHGTLNAVIVCSFYPISRVLEGIYSKRDALIFSTIDANLGYL